MTSPAPPDPAAALGDPGAYAGAALECDLVMKGGVASGVVYPLLVCELARAYRLRSIGGTSVGAVAAAAAAAAEHAGHAAAGGDVAARGSAFARLAALPRELGGTTADGRPFILALFRPDRGTARAFRLAAALAADGRRRGRLAAIVTVLPRATLAALAAALTALVVAALGGPLVALAALAVLFGALACAARATLGELRRWRDALTANDFGLCRLGPPDDPAGDGPPPLTLWLHELLQSLAGRAADGPPLTFADLWTGGGGSEADRDVDLQLIAVDLTHARPIRLPVAQEHAPEHALLFDPDELARLFPPSVVAHLREAGGPADPAIRALAGGRRLHRLPVGGELPVIVAVRMSLSFPVLISAVRLWQHDPGHPAGPRVAPVFISDGGIASNFPVQLFDAPLPGRPTFAVDLTQAPRAATVTPELRPARWSDISGLTAFGAAIKDTAQNWRDNAQAELPGYRERVIGVALKPGDGGLNLQMTDAEVQGLAAQGADAGRTLVTRFAGAPGAATGAAAWQQHRFDRYRLTVEAVERYAARFGTKYDAGGYAAVADWDGPPPEGWFPSAAAQERAHGVAAAVRDAGAGAEPHIGEHRPPPRPDLRAMPPT